MAVEPLQWQVLQAWAKQVLASSLFFMWQQLLHAHQLAVFEACSSQQQQVLLLVHVHFLASMDPGGQGMLE